MPAARPARLAHPWRSARPPPRESLEEARSSPSRPLRRGAIEPSEATPRDVPPPPSRILFLPRPADPCFIPEVHSRRHPAGPRGEPARRKVSNGYRPCSERLARTPAPSMSQVLPRRARPRARMSLLPAAAGAKMGIEMLISVSADILRRTSRARALSLALPSRGRIAPAPPRR